MDSQELDLQSFASSSCEKSNVDTLSTEAVQVELQWPFRSTTHATDAPISPLSNTVQEEEYLQLNKTLSAHVQDWFFFSPVLFPPNAINGRTRIRYRHDSRTGIVAADTRGTRGAYISSSRRASHYSPRCPSPCRILRRRESSAPCSWPSIVYHSPAAYGHRRPRRTRTPAAIQRCCSSSVPNSPRNPKRILIFAPLTDAVDFGSVRPKVSPELRWLNQTVHR